ncbi:MAG: TIGR03621 family F420-dependent LLM class oxidoreductase [Myxococcota bacterium]
MPQPFRFGVQLSQLPAEDWRERVQRLESQGYSTVFWPDHFGPQWDPVAALAAVASVTERLNVGSLVYDVDYRHPVIHAKAAATIHLLSGGRFEFGLGAGWMKSDYDQAGMAYDRPGIRISRLEEALQIVRSMWANESTSFEGRHYRVTEVPKAAALSEGDAPRILVGGGGPRVLRVAGTYADIVGINPSLPEGRVTSTTAADLTPDRVREKVGWVHEAASAAGRDPERLELNALVFVVAMADDPKPIREGIAKNTGMSVDEVAGCPIFLTGPPSEIVDRLAHQREQTGISYVTIQGGNDDVLARFAEEVVAPLTRS